MSDYLSDLSGGLEYHDPNNGGVMFEDEPENEVEQVDRQEWPLLIWSTWPVGEAQFADQRLLRTCRRSPVPAGAASEETFDAIQERLGWHPR